MGAFTFNQSGFTSLIEPPAMIACHEKDPPHPMDLSAVPLLFDDILFSNTAIISLGEKMDSFEKMLSDLNAKQGEEKEKEIARLKGDCICADCPTYNKCAGDRQELLYCFLGKSPQCIKDELGCVCPDCPVAAEADLVNLYYCTVGSEKEMREK
jgi:hypothetical protein